MTVEIGEEAPDFEFRASFLIDKDGKVVERIESQDLGTPRQQERYTDALAKL